MMHFAPGPDPVLPERLPKYSAKELLGESLRAEIDLDGKVYTLRITRAGKLILTK